MTLSRNTPSPSPKTVGSSSTVRRQRVRITDYQPARKTQVLGLFRRHFGARYATRLADQWDWQFVDNPYVIERQPLLTLLETEHGAVVGALLGHPVPLRFNGERRIALCGGGLVIDPDYRFHCLYLLQKHLGAPPGFSGGLVTQVRTLYERNGAVFIPLTLRRHVLPLRDQGARCLRARERLSSALKNANRWVPRRLQRFRVGAHIAGWTVPRISTRLVALASGRWREPAPYAASTGPRQERDIRPIRYFDAAYDDLWNKVGASFACTVERDSTYMNWRYLRAPHHHPLCRGLYERNRLTAVAVATHWTEKDCLGGPGAVHADLVELLAEDPDSSAVRQLVEQLLHEVDRKHRVDTVGAFACTPGHERLLSRLGFEVRDDPRFAMAVNWSGDISEQSLNHHLSWYASSSDADCLYSSCL